MKTLIKRLSFRSNKGSIIVLTALAAIGLIGMVGLAVDGGYIYLTYNKMHLAADAGALAAAARMPDIQAADVMAKELSARNGFVHGIDTVTVHLEQRPLSANPDYLWVTVSKKVPVFFMRVLGFNTFDIKAESAAMKFNWLPVHITEGLGVYGCTGVHFLNCFGYNRRKSLSDLHSSKWNDDGTLNPDYNENGFDYVLNVPDDYALNNNTTMLCVDIYDADCWNTNDDVDIQDLTARTCIDEIDLKDDTVDGNNRYYSDTHPPSGQGRTTTTFEIYSPEDNLNPFASFTWSEGDDVSKTNLKWFSPAGFTFDTSAHGGPGNYRINVKAGEGTSRNVYHLRSGPPISKKSELSELAIATGYFVPEDHVITLEFDMKKLNDPNDMQVIIGTHTFQNGDLGLVQSGGAAQHMVLDVTQWVDTANLGVSFSDLGDADNDITNMVFKVDGVQIGPLTPLLVSGVPVNNTLVKIDPSAAYTYRLEWEALSWDQPMEVSVYFNSNDLNWEATQGLTSISGTKIYGFDVTQMIAGDSGFVALRSNNHNPPDATSSYKAPEIRNLILKRSDGYWKTFIGDTWTLLDSLPLKFDFTGLGDNAGWGSGTQFNPDNGSSISSIDQLFLTEFNRNSGQINSTLGYLPESFAGTDVLITGVGNYSGTRWLDFFDSDENNWEVIKPESGDTAIKTATLPLSDSHDGSTIYTEYPAGGEGRSTWYLGITTSNMETPKSKVRLVE